MAKQKIWNSVEEIFTKLNESDCNYIVMRNFECFKSGEVFQNGHDDIDLLCDDLHKVRRLLDARSRFRFPTINSYYICFKNLVLPVDIRYIGDGYYDKNWQENMLQHKTIFNKNIYVPDQESYFFSLTYHALFHKYTLSQEYLTKLSLMATELGFSCDSEIGLRNELMKYLIKKNYKVTLTKDPAIILNFSNIEKKWIKKRITWVFKRKLLNLLRTLKKG